FLAWFAKARRITKPSILQKPNIAHCKFRGLYKLYTFLITDSTGIGRPVMYAFVDSQKFAPMRELFGLFKEMMGEHYPVRTFVMDKLAVQMRAARVVFGHDVMLCYFHIRKAIEKHVWIIYYPCIFGYRRTLILHLNPDGGLGPGFCVLYDRPTTASDRWCATDRVSYHADCCDGEPYMLCGDALQACPKASGPSKKRIGVLATRSAKGASYDVDLDRSAESQHSVSRKFVFVRVFGSKKELLNSHETLSSKTLEQLYCNDHVWHFILAGDFNAPNAYWMKSQHMGSAYLLEFDYQPQKHIIYEFYLRRYCDVAVIHGFTDFCTGSRPSPKFPGLVLFLSFSVCRSPERRKRKKGVALLFMFSAWGNMLASARNRVNKCLIVFRAEF
ncbi:hypothetical protein CLF_112991, partial [Clonorchis sinensis]